MTARGRRYSFACLALSLCLAGGPEALMGQGGGGAGGSISVTTIQPLAYGTLAPGTPDAVTVTDPVRRAELEISAQGWMEIVMVLPVGMTSPSGALIPLQFAFGDAGLQPRGSTGVTLFDPRLPYLTQLQGNQTPARLFLGGLASPDPNQAAGDYTAQITILVAKP